MESIKHKMDTMVKEKDAAIEKAMGFEAETAELEKAASKFEKEVDEIQRKIAKVEDQLDIAMSSTKETADKLEIADKESIDAELQVKISRNLENFQFYYTSTRPVLIIVI